jgi:hypothetical protein
LLPVRAQQFGLQTPEDRQKAVLAYEKSGILPANVTTRAQYDAWYDYIGLEKRYAMAIDLDKQLRKQIFLYEHGKYTDHEKGKIETYTIGGIVPVANTSAQARGTEVQQYIQTNGFKSILGANAVIEKYGTYPKALNNAYNIAATEYVRASREYITLKSEEQRLSDRGRSSEQYGIRMEAAGREIKKYEQEMTDIKNVMQMISIFGNGVNANQMRPYLYDTARREGAETANEALILEAAAMKIGSVFVDKLANNEIRFSGEIVAEKREFDFNITILDEKKRVMGTHTIKDIPNVGGNSQSIINSTINVDNFSESAGRQ